MRDTVNLIREGIPAVGLVHLPFKTLAELAVKQVGMPDAPVLAYPRDLPNQEPPDLLARKAQEVVARAVGMLLAVGESAAR